MSKCVSCSPLVGLSEADLTERQAAMQVMEDMDQARHHAAVEAIAAGARRRINQIGERRGAGAREILESLHRNPACRGLAFAIPMSLSLWAMIGLLLWAMVR